jgi:hypothetical protein
MARPEWVDWEALTTATDLTPIMEFLRDTTSDRKLRLHAVACGRRVWDMLTDEESRQSVAVAERLADGRVTEEQRKAVSRAASRVASQAEYDNFGDDTATPYVYALCIASYATYPSAFQAARNATKAIPHTRATNQDTEKQWLIDVLRDIFAGQFLPVSISPGWLTPTVLSLAQAIYEQRCLPSGALDNARLAVLADALEDVGCEYQEILSHCRQPGKHVRGCWVVDALLTRD